MRKVKILQCDSGGEKYLAQARAQAAKMPRFGVHSMTFPDATVRIHAFGDMATVFITAGDFGWVYSANPEDEDLSAWWVYDDVTSASGDQDDIDENSVELPSPLEFLVGSVADNSGVVTAEVMYNTDRETHWWRKAIGIDPEHRGSLSYLALAYTLTPPPFSINLVERGWDELPLESSHAPLGAVLYQASAGARLNYEYHLVNRSDATRQDGIVAGDGSTAIFGFTADIVAQSNWDTYVCALFTVLVTLDPSDLGTWLVYQGTGGETIENMIPTAAGVYTYYRIVQVSSDVGWALMMKAGAWALYLVGESGGNLELSGTETYSGTSPIVVARGGDNIVAALAIDIGGGDTSAVIIDATVYPTTKATLADPFEVTSIAYVAPGVAVVAGGGAQGELRTINMTTGATIDTYTFNHNLSSVVEFYDGTYARVKATTDAGTAWAKVEITDSGEFVTNNAAISQHNVPDALGWGWPR